VRNYGMSEPRVRIARVVGFGLLAEVVTAVIVVSALRIFASGDEVAALRLRAILEPGFGVFFTYIAAMLAARPVPDRARLHGVLVGVVASVLTVPGMFVAPAMLPIYLGAVLLKLAAGWAAGAQIEWKGREA
jgi:hypothetical protein